MAHTGHRRTVAASDDTGLQIEQSQFDLGEGPSVDAFITGSPVLAEDVARPDQRWPVFAAEVSRRGVRALDAYPLQQDDVTIGVLVLYHDQPGVPTQAEHSEYLLVADAVRIALLTYLHQLDPMAEPAGGDDNKAVSEAIGMVMEQLGTNANIALARMRAAAFVAGFPLSDIARDITDRTLRFDSDSP
jgi:GAF domain-containing protein